MPPVDDTNKDVGNEEISTGESVGFGGIENPSLGGPSGDGLLYNDGSSYVLLNDTCFILLNG